MTSVPKALKISFLSVVAGWAAGMVFPVLGFACAALSNPRELVWAVVTGAIMGGFAFAAWILAVLPLTLFLPKKSAIWSPGITPIAGSAAGILIIVVCGIVQTYRLTRYNDLQVNSWVGYVLSEAPFALFAALVGGVTGMVLSHLVRKSDST